MLWSLTRNYVAKSKFLRDRKFAIDIIPVNQIILEKKAREHCINLGKCKDIRRQYREDLDNKIEIFDRQRKPYQTKMKGVNRELVGLFFSSGAYRNSPRVAANEIFMCKYLPPSHLLYKAASSHPAAVLLMASTSLPNHGTAVARHKIRRMFVTALWDAYQAGLKSDSTTNSQPNENFRDGIYLFQINLPPSSLSWLYSEMQQIMEIISIPHVYKGEWIHTSNSLFANSLLRRPQGFNREDSKLSNVPELFFDEVNYYVNRGVAQTKEKGKRKNVNTSV